MTATPDHALSGETDATTTSTKNDVPAPKGVDPTPRSGGPGQTSTNPASTYADDSDGRLSASQPQRSIAAPTHTENDDGQGPASSPPIVISTSADTNGDAPSRRTIPLAGLAIAGVFAVVIGTWLTAPDEAPGIPVPGILVDYGLPVTRLLLDLAALATVGLSLLPKLLGFDDVDRTEPIAARARHWAVMSALTWCAAALLATLLSAAEVMPGQIPDVGAYVETIGSGQGLIVSASAALLSAAVGTLAIRFGEKVPAELRVLIAMFGLLPLPVTGHASNWYWHDLSMVSMELHVIGASAWTGGLLAVTLFLATNRSLLATTLPRFSRLATICLFLVGLSGLFNGIVELLLTPTEPFPASLLTTGYGQLLLAKTAFAAAIALLAANIRWRLLPRITQAHPTAFATWAALELTIMGLAYGVAVALTRAPVA
ncbi:copper resistance protein CopD [Acrocarpospora pleiomorpha]|uniref:Copper resistance protein CopD n=1 Tax=Acrocarpospora pleiomorpha TaxID=90975 RepID=A0A5M3XD02_9ACTN|nr:CopD family protein [Acrocarpospora pleiomorpha]GES18980.1 copper resistance protein CopD [Acrocarpospora pleiomorpha]